MANAHDKWVWGTINTKIFSVSSCYTFIKPLLPNMHMSGEILFNLHVIWKSVMPPKAAFFCRRLFLGRLSTKDNLVKRLVLVDNMFCPFFSIHEECIHNFFSLCFL